MLANIEYWCECVYVCAYVMCLWDCVVVVLAAAMGSATQEWTGICLSTPSNPANVHNLFPLVEILEKRHFS